MAHGIRYHEHSWRFGHHTQHTAHSTEMNLAVGAKPSGWPPTHKPPPMGEPLEETEVVVMLAWLWIRTLAVCIASSATDHHHDNQHHQRHADHHRNQVPSPCPSSQQPVPPSPGGASSTLDDEVGEVVEEREDDAELFTPSWAAGADGLGATHHHAASVMDLQQRSKWGLLHHTEPGMMTEASHRGLDVYTQLLDEVRRVCHRAGVVCMHSVKTPGCAWYVCVRRTSWWLIRERAARARSTAPRRH